LKVYNQIGAIIVESFDKDKIEINITKRATTKKLLQEVKVNIDVKDNRAIVKAEIDSTKSSELDISVNIKVPKCTKLESLTTNVGAITVRNIDNLVDVKTDVGAIKLNNINGNIIARADVGSIALSLPKNINAMVKVGADVGKISSDFKEIKVKRELPYGSSQASGKLGNGKNNIDLSANVGSISIKKIL